MVSSSAYPAGLVDGCRLSYRPWSVPSRPWSLIASAAPTDRDTRGRRQQACGKRPNSKSSKEPSATTTKSGRTASYACLSLMAAWQTSTTAGQPRAGVAARTYEARPICVPVLKLNEHHQSPSEAGIPLSRQKNTPVIDVSPIPNTAHESLMAHHRSAARTYISDTALLLLPPALTLRPRRSVSPPCVTGPRMLDPTHASRRPHHPLPAAAQAKEPDRNTRRVSGCYIRWCPRTPPRDLDFSVLAIYHK